MYKKEIAKKKIWKINSRWRTRISKFESFRLFPLAEQVSKGWNSVTKISKRTSKYHMRGWPFLCLFFLWQYYCTQRYFRPFIIYKICILTKCLHRTTCRPNAWKEVWFASTDTLVPLEWSPQKWELYRMLHDDYWCGEHREFNIIPATFAKWGYSSDFMMWVRTTVELDYQVFHRSIVTAV